MIQCNFCHQDFTPEEILIHDCKEHRGYVWKILHERHEAQLAQVKEDVEAAIKLVGEMCEGAEPPNEDMLFALIFGELRKISDQSGQMPMQMPPGLSRFLAQKFGQSEQPEKVATGTELVASQTDRSTEAPKKPSRFVTWLKTLFR